MPIYEAYVYFILYLMTCLSMDLLLDLFSVGAVRVTVTSLDYIYIEALTER